MKNICLWIVMLLFSLAAAPLLTGIINKVKAFFAGRRGPRILQLYYDLAKLWQKESVYSRTVTWVFRIAPMVSLSSLLCAMALLPFATVKSPVGFAGDVLLFIHLLALGRVLTVLAAMDTGSSFAGMGSAREIHFSAMVESTTLCVMAFLLLITGKLSLSTMFSGFTVDLWQNNITTIVLIAAAFAVVLLTESCRVPVDDPETHLELTMIHEAMILDYSGVDMAMILYGASLKLWTLASLFTMIVLPLGSLPLIYAVPAYIAGVFVTAALIGLLESVTARFRLLKLPQLLVGALCCSMAGIVLLWIFKGGVR